MRTGAVNRARTLIGCGLALYLFLAAGTTRAALVPATGDLRAFLINTLIADKDSQGFEEPSAADIATWQAAIAALLDGDFATAASLGQSQAFDLYEYTDSASGRLYYVLREQRPGGGAGYRGLGTYVLNPTAERLLNIQCPHPLYDRTRDQSCEIFLQTGALFLQISGAHRCANSESSDCGGLTKACGDGTESIPYRISDDAHFLRTFFQAASDEVAARIPNLVSVSVHQFGPCSPATESSIAMISNGTDQYVANGLATQLARQYNLILDGLPYPGAGAGSCNADPGSPEAPVSACQWGDDILCGGLNTQGMSLNSGGPPTDCVALPASPGPGEERFVHIEQQPILNEAPAYGVTWQVTIDAIANTFPVETWVDFSYVGPQAGTYFQPFSTLAAAVAGIAEGERIWIKAGSTDEAPTLVKPLLLESYQGSATIGR